MTGSTVDVETAEERTPATRPLRAVLLFLVFITAIPLVAFAVLASALLVQYTGEHYIGAIKDRNRAFMSAVDAEIRATISTLELLSSAESLKANDLREFDRDARTVLATQRSWFNVILLGRDGRQFVNTGVQFGTPLPEVPVDPDSFARLIESRRPLVGDVVPGGPFFSKPGIPVRVPVMREGAIVYVLTALLDPQIFASLLAEQRLPSGWASGLVDMKGQLVARLPYKPVGAMASPDYLRATQASREGWYRGVTLDGIDTYTAHTRSSLTGWSLGFAIPAREVTAAPRHAAMLIACGGVISLTAAVWLALRYSRRISGPITQLARLAPALGHRESQGYPDSGILEVAELSRALRQASSDVFVRDEKLRAADRSKSEFLALLSHELRNPLAALVNGMGLLRSHNAGATHNATLDLMDRQVRLLVRLIDDLIDISRIDRGKMEFHFETVPVEAAVLAAIETSKAMIERRGHSLHVDLPPTPTYIRADAARIAQVISNLLNNAAKFTPNGGRIEVAVQTGDDDVRIVVSDNGIGFEQKDRDRLFEIFMQLDSARRQSTGGLGLGLALARFIVEGHAGSIGADSAGPGQGATFTVLLPRAPAPTSSDPAPQPARRLCPSRILVVDDNVDACTTLAEVLKLHGHCLAVAHDGEAALNAAATLHPEIVLLDLDLPRLNGIEVGTRLRRMPGGTSMLIIAVTGMGQPYDVQRTSEAGFDLHITKPITAEQVVERIVHLRETSVEAVR